jgi:hypothetical protein
MELESRSQNPEFRRKEMRINFLSPADYWLLATDY